MIKIRFKPGLTLIETLVAAVITIIIAGSIYGLLSSARRTASLAKAKGEIKEMAEIVLRQLEKDISTSKVELSTVGTGGNTSPKITTSFKPVGDGWEMIVPEDNTWMKVNYQLDLPRLTRIASNTSRVLCSHLKNLKITSLSDEQLSIDLEVELIPEGMTSPVSHRQTMLVTIREAVKYKLDPRWRSTKDVVNSY